MIKKDVITPNGISIRFAEDVICGEPIGEFIFEPSPDLFLFSKWWFTKKYRCGHRGPLKFELFVYGKIVYPARDNQKCPDCCMKEIRETVIRCASCEIPIFPPSAVSLCHPTTPGLNLAVANFLSNSAVITCMRCNPDYAGHWTDEGFIPYPFDDEK